MKFNRSRMKMTSNILTGDTLSDKSAVDDIFQIGREEEKIIREEEEENAVASQIDKQSSLIDSIIFNNDMRLDSSQEAALLRADIAKSTFKSTF
mmetsp:Transcript_22829/g.35148  ORF Transcript_22829/g.35148 Transcript_22829/m.35148 type:complete len:94 (-) Transcript_22829:1449-1730(-)